MIRTLRTLRGFVVGFRAQRTICALEAAHAARPTGRPATELAAWHPSGRAVIACCARHEPPPPLDDRCTARTFAHLAAGPGTTVPHTN